MSELREAAQAALTAYETFRDVDDIDGLDDAMDRLRAALAQPEVPCYAGNARKHVICVCPDCVATNYREWRPASEPPEVTVLPDGSAFGMMSFPLPYDHWMYRDREYLPGADEPVDLPKPILTHALREHVEAAVRYAVRGATNCGKELDFDPDALVLNAVYALCGPYGGASLRDIEPPTESTIATEIKAARNEFATWPKERQDAARVSAVAMTPSTEGE